MVDLAAKQLSGARTLSSNVARGATSIDITNATDIQAGDIINIQSTIAPAVNFTNDTKTDTVRVRSKTGSTLTLDDGLSFGWNTTDAGLAVYVFRPVRLTLRNPVIKLEQVDGNMVAKWGIRCTGFADVLIENPKIIGSLPFTRLDANPANENIYRYGIQLWQCVGWRVTNGDYFAMSYPLGISGGTRNGRETNSRARYCRHSHADLAGWSRGYHLDGLDDSDSRAALSVHPSFDCHARNVNVRNNLAIPAWRCIGGSLSGYYHTTEETTTPAECDAGPMNTGYESLYDDADYDYRNFVIDSPKRTTNTLRQRRGRRVFVEGVSASGMTVDQYVGNVVFGAGNSFGAQGRPTPRASDILTSGTVHASTVLDAMPILHLAYDAQTVDLNVGKTVTGGTSGAQGTIWRVQDHGTTGFILLIGVTGIFLDNEALTDSAGGAAIANGAGVRIHHIDPREQIVQQGNGRLSCRGVIGRNAAGSPTDADPAKFSIQLHTNAFVGLLQSTFTMGRIKLIAMLLHQNSGLFEQVVKEFNFCFGAAAGPSLLVFPTAPLFASATTGQTNAGSLTLTLINPTFAGVTQIGNNTDHFVQFDVQMTSGRTEPSYSLLYELELTDVNFS